MTFEEKYQEYVRTIHPDEALVETTRSKMLAELRPQEEAPVRSKKTVVRKRKPNKWLAYAGVAVAASLLTAVVLTGANRLLGAKGTSADKKSAETESVSLTAGAEFDVAEEETNELEYADITIYREENGKIVSDTQYMECSVEKIVDVWAMQNDVHDLTVNVVEFMDEGNAIAIHVDLSRTLIDQLDDEGVKLQALSMTLAEYLNADSVSITAEGELLG